MVESADWLATELYQLNTYPSLWVLNLKDKNDAASFKKITLLEQQLATKGVLGEMR